ncbi:MAG: MFS transporter, partial [Chloroflexi bacterium]|nr:MFS transporter [Chloroflexota bacterium]
ASQNMEWLIMSRAVQGLGAGVLLPVSLATIADLYPPAKRGRVQGLFAAVLPGLRWVWILRFAAHKFTLRGFTRWCSASMIARILSTASSRRLVRFTTT